MMRVDLAGCLPDHLYSIWMSYSTVSMNTGDAGAFDPGAAFGARGATAPAGGLPATLQTDDNGQGRFERLLDPAVWFHAGPCSFCTGHGGAANIPPSTGTLVIIMFTHTNAQTNGNNTACPFNQDGSGNCATMGSQVDLTAPYSPGFVVLPGGVPIDAQITQLAFLPLSNLQ
jgi:hypothetical protein